MNGAWDRGEGVVRKGRQRGGGNAHAEADSCAGKVGSGAEGWAWMETGAEEGWGRLVEVEAG